MKTADSLVVWDIDNTLLTNWKGWNIAFERLGMQLGVREDVKLSMTQTPDGRFDPTFSVKTPFGLMCERLSQVGFNGQSLSERDFYHALGVAGSTFSYGGLVEPFPGVHEFVRKVGKLSSRRMAIVSGGPRQMQIRVLHSAGLLDLFDIDASKFGGEFQSKSHALGFLAHAAKPGLLVYFDDAPGGMRAVIEAPCNPGDAPTRLAAGVTIAGLTTFFDLRNAGADVVIESFDESSFEKLQGSWPANCY